MEFKHKRQQWAVGHGFFHTASIEIDNSIYRYVYDCGGKTKDIVEAEIDRYKTNEDLDARDQYLDMLVISHFHRDHINGIPHLLTKFKIKKLVIPFLSEDMQIVILAYLASINEWTVFSGLVTDPGGWLKDRGSEDVEIIQVPEDKEGEFDAGSILSGNSDEDGLKIGKKRTSLGAIFKNKHCVWRFKFYFEDNQSLANCIIQDILKTFDIGNRIDLLAKLKDAAWIFLNYQKLKNCFTTVVASGKQNSINLSMYSGAVNPYYIYRSNFYPPGTLTACCCFREDRVGWLGTGDAELKIQKKFDEFKNGFKSFLNTIDTVTVPHHGSRHDYNAKIADIGFRHIITSDHEKSPASEVLLNLRINSPSVQIVTTDQCTALFDFFSGVFKLAKPHANAQPV